VSKEKGDRATPRNENLVSLMCEELVLRPELLNKPRNFMIAAVGVKSHRTANGGHVFITACQTETF